MQVAVIIVNYRSAGLAIEAARSALPDVEQIPSAKIFIVDNDSPDDSRVRLAQAIADNQWQTRVTLLNAPKNGGFGYGNNFAIRHALAEDPATDYFYLLNPDALLRPGTLLKLLQHMEATPRAGFAGTGIFGTDGVQHRTVFRFPAARSEFASGLQLGLWFKLFPRASMTIPIPSASTKVDWLGGASLLIRKSTLDDVGLFDENFFLYFEEIDLIQRAARKGWETWYVADSMITHIESAATGVADKTRPMPKYWFDSRRYYFRKNHGFWYLQLANISWVLGHCSGHLKNVLLGKGEQRRKRFVRDFIRHWIGG